jgi:ADP-L-glycero-D-manno-heptose 6-epimerase
MIIVTGGAGFIGSAIVWRLNQKGYDEIIIVDEFGESASQGEKWKNLVGLKYAEIFDKEDFGHMLAQGDFIKNFQVETIFHLGACSSTTEKNFDYLLRNNYEYSKYLCDKAVSSNVRFIYASSAATYGDGSNGYSDDESKLHELRPLNGYGYSKHMFDLWALRSKLFDKIAGLKYFNVFGPNEYHKNDMRSVVNKSFDQIKEAGKARLFKSDRADIADGEQKRDFLYVKDAADMTIFFHENKIISGIYNIGTGKANSFNSLVKPIFKAMNIPENIEYFEMPGELKSKYQYYTKAEINKLKSVGYKNEISTTEDAVTDYVKNYLNTGNPYLH